MNKQNSYTSWVAIAQEDLAMAKSLLDQGYFRGASFHAQQCAQKALKGFLVHSHRTANHATDLVQLVDQCKDVDASFSMLMDEARKLEPYITESYFPAFYEPLDFDRTCLLLDHAAHILSFAEKKVRKESSSKKVS